MTPSAGYTLDALLDNGQDVTPYASPNYGNSTFVYTLSYVTTGHGLSVRYKAGAFPTPSAQVPALPPYAALVVTFGISGYLFWISRKRRKST